MTVLKTPVSPEDVQPESIDVFTSSHVLEHITDPCVWLAGLTKAMKAGGIVFTEVPRETRMVRSHKKPGIGHVLFFDGKTFHRMMTLQDSFEKLLLRDDGLTLRSVYRKSVSYTHLRAHETEADL
eukprot:3608763-Amphidinium_carterae.1